ncbi:uncharacterized protein [Diadema setosum]|uniref:uncharacterized protein n=1 Tax=Diadema setosum TaxID=31175 RepID=UPI003B3B8985
MLQNRLDELTWHNGNIPEGEIWVKVGGDKGKGTFKLMIQIANVGRPSSLHNTRVILLFPGNDSPYNLQVALKSVQAQIEELSHSYWREKKIRLFAFGDCEYLTRMYGLSGPSGRHCCLHCSATRQDMSIPPAERKATQQTRTLQSLDVSLNNFTQHGIAKEANNVIRSPFFRIPIDQVCPPGLHISLGLFLKHFNSMSGKCHELDVKIMERLTVSETELSNAKTAYKQAMRKFSLQSKAKELEEEIDDLIQQHTMIALLYDTEPPATILEMAEEKRKEKCEVDKEISNLPEVRFGTGPVMTRLEMVLQKLKVCRQAYDSKSFVGNHVHKCLQPQNVDLLTASITETVQEACPHDQSLHQEAFDVECKYNKVFKLYGQCHKAMNRAGFMNEEEIHQLDGNIKAYMTFCRHTFPNETVTPKQHLLEEHVVPFLSQWKAPAGLLGEQGGEAVHSQLNNILDDLRGYHDALKRQLQCVKNQWVVSSPQTYNKFSKDR